MMRAAMGMLLLPVGFPAARAAEVLTWEACVAQAEKHHPELASSRSQLEASRQQEAAARGELFPQLSASAGASRGPDAAGVAGNDFSLSVSGSLLLFDGFRTWNNISRSHAQARASAFTYQQTSARILLSLRRAFVDLLLQQARIGLNRDIVARREQNVKLVRLRHEAGREHRGSLLQAEAQLARARLELTQSERSLALAQFELARQLGRQAYGPLAVTGDLQPPAVSAAAPDFKALADNHPQAQQAAAQAEAAQASWQAANGSFFPSLSARGSLGRAGEDWPFDRAQWSAGLSLSWDLFNGGQRWAQVAASRAQLDSARAEVVVAQQSVYANLLQTWNTLQNSLDQLAVDQKFLEAARERSKIAEMQYTTGLLTFDNWSIIEDDYVAARKNYLADQAEALKAEAGWKQARGGFFDDEA